MLLPILCLIFLLSGASALLFETLWFRGAGLSFGNTVWASSITLAAYMGGLALGNALAGRLGQRVRHPLRTYAFLELLIALTGLLLVPLLPALASVLAPLLGSVDDNLWWSTPLRLSVVFMLLMIPTTAMGATLPLLVMALCRTKTGFGKALGYLYGFNTLGAMAGAVAGEVFLVKAFGLLGTGISAALLNVLAAVLSLLLSTRTISGASVALLEPPASVAGIRYSWRIWIMLLAGCLSGAALLGAEVIWFRFLRLFFLDTDATFAVMLAVILAGIALGGVLAGAILSRWPQYHAVWAITAAGLCGVAFAVSYSFFNARGSHGYHWYVNIMPIAKLSLFLMFPTALASGALFTFLGQAIHTVTRTDVEAAAALTTANTTGAMLGALLAAFVFLPELGIEKSIWILTCMYGAVFVLLVAALGVPQKLMLRAAYATTAVALVCAIILFPFGRMKAHLDTASEKFRTTSGSHTVAVHEGLNETLQYVRNDLLGQPVSYTLMTNGFSMSSSHPGARRYMGMYAYWPAAVHPSLKSALLISYGVGNTAKSLTQLASLHEIHIVDISRDIIRYSEVPYPGQSNPLKDPRVRVHIEDGRFYLQSTAQRFDLITSEPPPPRAPGVINLYTEEYFRLIRERLTDGGFATYWLPVHNMTGADARSIIKGFCNAFPDCGLWEGLGTNWMLTGSRGAKIAALPEQFSAQWRDSKVFPALEEIGLERPEMLGATFMADAVQLGKLLGDTLPLTDNFPKRYSQDFPVEADNQFYSAWMDPQRTMEHYLTSSWILHFWPTNLRLASTDYFLVNQAFNDDITGKGMRLQMIAETLKHPGLVTPILWVLGTSRREVEIARTAAGSSDPAVAYILGADELAHGNFATAANHFENALNAGDKRASAPLLFCACRAGQGERARMIAATHALGDVRNHLARCW